MEEMEGEGMEEEEEEEHILYIEKGSLVMKGSFDTLHLLQEHVVSKVFRPRVKLPNPVLDFKM